MRNQRPGRAKQISRQRERYQDTKNLIFLCNTGLPEISETIYIIQNFPILPESLFRNRVGCAAFNTHWPLIHFQSQIHEAFYTIVRTVFSYQQEFFHFKRNSSH